MPYCRKCGNEVDENARFCPKCGTPIAPQSTPTLRSRREKQPLHPFAIIGIVVVAIVVLVALIFGAFLIGGLLPFNRVVGSGNLQTREVTLADFSEIEIHNGFRVQVSYANSYRVAIITDDNLLDYVEVNKNGDTLQISLRTGASFQTSTLRAEITLPVIDRLELSGGTTATVSGFTAINSFRAELSGGSQLEMNGKTTNLVAIASGGSRLELASLNVNSANVELSGGSQGTVNVTGVLNAELSGGSQLYYIGNPTLGNITTSGGSTISRKQAS